MKTRYLIWLIGFILILSLVENDPFTGLTGLVVRDDIGCCTNICQQTLKDNCQGDFQANKQCSQLEQCNIGCCIDEEGYCFSNYLESNCNGNFVKSSECMQYPKCTSAKQRGSLLGPIGYPIIYRSFEKGLLFTEPISGIAGQQFIIKVLAFENTSMVKAFISEGDYSKELRLYDDGSHGDGNANDNLYAAVWDSSRLSVEGIKRIQLTAKMLTSDQEVELDSQLILSSTNCLLLREPWNETTQSVVFNDDIAAKNLLSQLAYTPLQSELDKLNYFISNEPDIESMETQCSSIAPDTFVFFDATDYCIKQGKKIIIPPAFIVGNVTALSIKGFFEDFCNHTYTMKQLYDMANLSLQPPAVTLTLPENSTSYSSSEVDFSFVINDTKDQVVNYEVYFDMNHPLTILARGSAVSGQEINLTLNITDGQHEVWVEAQDSDDNLGVSSIVSIDVNTANFIVSILSLDPIYYNASPEINFTVSHDSEEQVQYEVQLNDTVNLTNNRFIANVTNIDEMVTIPTALNNGSYIIRVTATDSSHRTAVSLPYPIIIGPSDEEEE